MKCLLVKPGLIDYGKALRIQEQTADARREGLLADDVLLLLEHPPTITVGKQGTTAELLADGKVLSQAGVQVHHIGRGGRLTYHGPGQVVGDPILDLREHGRDLHQYLRSLEEVIIRTLAQFDISAARSQGLTGVWVKGAKIASIGIQVKRWVSMHGFALNVCPDMNHFRWLQPCGFSADVMTSMHRLDAKAASMKEVASALEEAFGAVFKMRLVSTPLSALEERVQSLP